MTCNRIACFDLESDGLLDEATRLWCACVIDLIDGSERTFTPDNVDGLCSYLATFDILVGHNIIGYDFPLLRKLYGWDYKGEKVDTVLISRTQRPNRLSPPHCPNKYAPHSVEAWGYRLGDYKLSHEDWSQFSEEMLQRCIQDTRLNVKIYHALLEEGKGEGWENAHKLNAKLFHYLQLQEEYGWCIDVPCLDRHIATLDRWVTRIDRAVAPKLPLVVEVLETKTAGEYNFVRKPFKKDGSYAEIVHRYMDQLGNVGVGGPFSRIEFRAVDIDSNHEVKDFLLASGWIPSEWNTNNNGEKTSPKFSKDDQFQGIKGGLARLLAKRVICRARKSILEGWKASLRDDGRLASRVTGLAATGRAKHAGIVNVPNPGSKAFFARQMREVFIASPGWVMVGVDSKGNQIRQLAARMGDTEFSAAVLAGDPHSLNQKRVGVPVSRNAIKAFFYSLIFGAQANKIGKILKISPQEAKALIKAYMEGMPKLAALIERETEAWRKSAKKTWNARFKRWEYRDGYITAIDGRQMLVEQEHTVLVYLLQSDEAVQLATAYVWFFKDMEKAGYKLGEDFRPLTWYHDEFQIDCKPTIAEATAKIASECIAKAGRFYHINIQHEGDWRIGRNWAECH